MSQYNLGSLSSSNTAIRVVEAGDPPTLILNHSTKNSVYIGGSNAVGTGNLLDATPLDPYASLVVNGQVDVFAVAVDQTLPATVYTYQNAINWTPKAIQPNITDSHSPLTTPAVGATVDLQVPEGAQGLAVWRIGAGGYNTNWKGLEVVGLTTNTTYINVNPGADQKYYYVVPILSDADSTVSVTFTSTFGAPVQYELVWIMSSFMAGIVPTGQVQDVSISAVGIVGGNLPVSVNNTPNVNVVNTPTVVPSFSHIDDRSIAANQTPLNFNVSLAAGATTTLLPASVGVQYFLHDLWCQINSGNMLSFHIQDTTPTDLGVFINIVTGTPANAYRPPNPPFDFKGAPVASGLGIILKNGGATTESFVGSLTYSK